LIRYYITDRRAAGGLQQLHTIIQRNARAVDWVQIREKDLSARELTALVRAAVAAGAQVLVNDRVDVALTGRAAGVHLPSHAVAPREIRRITPVAFMIAVSCHSIEEVRRAEEEGADFVVFGPVFYTASKAPYGEPVGLQKLFEAARSVRIPVLALGGIDDDNVAECLAAGAAGIAGITLFQR
jgi:thiamine-phosphate pyrophosphorylase